MRLTDMTQDKERILILAEYPKESKMSLTIQRVKFTRKKMKTDRAELQRL